MPVIQGLVNAPSNVSAGDGQNNPFLQGKQNELVVAEIHGKAYTQNYRGNVYYASTAAAGVTISIFSNASFTGLGIWNPQGSGKNLSMIETIWNPQTVETAMAGIGYAWLTNTGASLGTAAPLSATTPITATRGSGNIGIAAGQGASAALVVSAATLTTAMTWGRPAPGYVSTGAITTTQSGALVHNLDGTMIVPPGTFLALTSSIASGGTAWVLSAVWEETPL